MKTETIISILARTATLAHTTMMQAAMLLAVFTTTASAQSTDPIFETTYTATSGTAGANTTEDYAMLVDGNKNTKWCVSNWDFSNSNYITIDFHSDIAFVPTGYVMTTGGDTGNNPNRNPKSWYILGKLNEEDEWNNWTHLLSYTSNDTQLQGVSTTDYEFTFTAVDGEPVTNTRPCKYFRLVILDIKGGNIFQLAEFQFKGHEKIVDLSTLMADDITNGKYIVEGREVLTGTLAPQYGVSIADRARATLSGATITPDDGPGIDCLGNASIVLADGTTNTVVGGRYCSGIRPKEGGTYNGSLFWPYFLYISGNGTLNVTSKDDWPGAPGIGAGDGSTCGRLYISGGIINATGSNFAPGIGAGTGGTCEGIEIQGGIINAVGGHGAAGIGSGYALDNKNSRCELVRISGGTVTASSGSDAPGIGSGYGSKGLDEVAATSTCGNVEIHAGTVIATGQGSAAGIGSGEGSSVCGDIIIGSRENYEEEISRVTAIKGNNALYSIGNGAGENCICGTFSIEDVTTSYPPQNTFTYEPGKLRRITFDANEGEGSMLTMCFSTLDNNSTFPLDANTFNRHYYTFSNWSTSSDGSGTTYSDGQDITPTDNMTLYAQWDEITRVLADGTAYTLTDDFDVFSATYTKTLGSDRKGKYQAWLVPFDYTITAADLEKFKFYKINMIANSPSPSVEATNEIWVFLTRLNAGDVLHANMPYVYKPLQAVSDYEFTTLNVTLKTKNTDILLDTRTTEDIYSFYATYENTTATTADPFYYVGINGNVSYGDNVTVGPYRWIIRKTNKFGSTPSYASKMYFYDGEETTSVNEEFFAEQSGKAERRVNSEESADAWYSLDGRRLNGKPTTTGLYIVGGRKVIIK